MNRYTKVEVKIVRTLARFIADERVLVGCWRLARTYLRNETTDAQLRSSGIYLWLKSGS